MDFAPQYLFLFGATAILSVFAYAKETPEDVFIVHGGTVHLKCDLPVSDDPDVEWVDRVYTSDENPVKIFHSRDNPHFLIHNSHPNRVNYQVNHKYTLTILNVDMDSDVGQYTCRSRVGDTVYRKKYYLTVGDLLACAGKSHLRSGEDTLLACEMNYSGKKPVLEWFEEGSAVDMIDEYEIRFAKNVVKVHATHRQDGAVFTCRMTIGNIMRECNITMNVTYTVHHPKFHPVKESFEPGDEIKCVAKGNPTPTITLTPHLPKSVNGSGWVAFIVEQSWVGQHVTVQCSASNVVDGVEVHSNPLNFTFFVSEVKPPPHHHHNHHHHPTTSTSQVENKDTEKHVPGDQNSQSSSQNHQPKPDVNPVQSSNDSGKLMTVSLAVTALLSLMTTIL